MLNPFANQHIPSKARLGLGTMEKLANLQAQERVSVDVLVARAVRLYWEQHQQQKVGGEQYGRTKEELEGVEQH